VQGPQAGQSYKLKRREHVCGVKVKKKHGAKHAQGTLRMASNFLLDATMAFSRLPDYVNDMSEFQHTNAFHM
jgi:hypothetical protein